MRERIINQLFIVSEGTPFSDREKEIMYLWVSGFKRREIAEILSIEEGTVRNHIHGAGNRKGIYGKARESFDSLIRNKTDLMNVLLDNGIIKFIDETS